MVSGKAGNVTKKKIVIAPLKKSIVAPKKKSDALKSSKSAVVQKSKGAIVQKSKTPSVQKKEKVIVHEILSLKITPKVQTAEGWKRSISAMKKVPKKA